MKALEIISKTRAYLDYLEEHVLNVQKAWKELQDKCSDMVIIYDDFNFIRLDTLVKSHDISKLGEYEFVQYRRKFFPASTEIAEPEEFAGAWDHHKNKNPHHWENWTKTEEGLFGEKCLHCVTMVLDWMAMGYKFGDTAQAYYEKNKSNIDIPADWEEFIYEIFSKVYPSCTL